jgi:hypothetical protein
MTKILISLFLLFNFGTISGQEFENLIRTEGGKTLYIYTENKFEIDESKFGNDKINIETNSGEIKRFFKGNYMIKPNRIGICTISIYNEDKSKKIFSEEFRVIFSEKPEIMPVFYSQKNGIRDNEIPKERLEDFAGFGMMISTQNEIIYLIEEMDLIIYSRKNGEFKFQTTGKFSAEIKEKINALNEGDLILLKNISVKSVTDYSKKDNPDQIINILPTVFFVK